MSKRKIILRWSGGTLALAAIALALYYVTTEATNDGIWKPEYEHLAVARIVDERIIINNFRRARYDDSGAPVEINWDRREVNLATLKDVWFGISVFTDIGIAHTFLSFDFGDGDPIVVSVEARQNPDQHYNPIAGVLDRYLLIYVVADERDIIGVRTHPRHDDVFFQPLKLSPARARSLFLDLLERVNGLAEQPEFYNTLTASCTNSLLKDTELPAWRRYLDWRALLPTYSDRIAYQYGVLDDRYTREQLRSAAALDPSTFTPDDADFSTRIRASFYQRIEALAE